ncbi:unnamed protein product (macronuclear) [Paramecium tetraurelia]|uniref:Uncharacterized protein n=1 Tax=Paramecium tetraurelia TaxID=5888 RepID=A0BM82_PARTE|nr:uncharacterized protein GSPATT00030283001 [Paramecium tetraurelia]CAK59649.1 unnamed protein product [Paramecium tetraurelia]|eukprot:XP_001427047.1 hypothetical protein (macronuclear) [Paramecium tetraurelia strain d4-2]
MQNLDFNSRFKITSLIFAIFLSNMSYFAKIENLFIECEKLILFNQTTSQDNNNKRCKNNVVFHKLQTGSFNILSNKQNIQAFLIRNNSVIFISILTKFIDLLMVALIIEKPPKMWFIIEIVPNVLYCATFYILAPSFLVIYFYCCYS